MIGNACKEITSSLLCWIKHQCISEQKLKKKFLYLYEYIFANVLKSNFNSRIEPEIKI